MPRDWGPWLGSQPKPTTIPVLIEVPSEGVKMLRETLCVAQSLIGQSDDARKAEHSERLGFLIVQCDVHRPLGPDGKHGHRHTPTCGCEDETSGPQRTNWLMMVRFAAWMRELPADDKRTDAERVRDFSNQDRRDGKS